MSTVSNRTMPEPGRRSFRRDITRAAGFHGGRPAFQSDERCDRVHIGPRQFRTAAYIPRVVVKFQDSTSLPYVDGAEEQFERLGIGPWKVPREQFPGIS